jgi:hypothetical protein
VRKAAGDQFTAPVFVGTLGDSTTAAGDIWLRPRSTPMELQSLFQPGIQGIAHPIPKEVEAQHSKKDGTTRAER